MLFIRIKIIYKNIIAQTSDVLKDAGIDMVSISLLSDNASDYNRIMKPQNGATFADVCSFIISCAEKGIIVPNLYTIEIIHFICILFPDLAVTCTAVEQPGVNMKNVRDLAISLGARDFVSSKYFP